MNSKNVHRCSIASEDMPFKKKLVLYAALVVLVFLWFIGVRNRGDGERYEAMRQMLGSYEAQLKETRLQMTYSVNVIQQNCDLWNPDLPVIYLITPTYARPVQKAELTRLAQTLLLVPNVHWIIVEDSENKTTLVKNFLLNYRLNATHLNVRTPKTFKRKDNEPVWVKPRGVIQRNMGLQWLRENRLQGIDKGVVYFADDDNTYSIQIFNEMRYTKRVSVWPVGLVGGLKVERPLINATGHVAGWNSIWRPERLFPIDMAGFAINMELLLKEPKAQFSYNVREGEQESAILTPLVKVDELEPVASNCTQVYVWHTRTEKPKFAAQKKLAIRKVNDDSFEV